MCINEVLYDPEGPDTGLEFVELLNCREHDVLLTGWTLETGNGASPGDWTVEWTGGDFDVLEPGERLVVGEAAVTPAPDVVTSLDLQNGPDGVRLTDGDRVVDTVGWGELVHPEYCEGAPAPDVASGRSLARMPDCRDSDDNARDLLSAEPTPGFPNCAVRDVAVSVRHRVGEILPEGDVTLTLDVANAGAQPVEAGAVTLRAFVDGAALPSVEAPLSDSLAVRDTVACELVVPSNRLGYACATVEAHLSGDADTTDNRAGTSFTIGMPGGRVAVNEVMHSPGEQETEWFELLGVDAVQVPIDGWRFGDDESQSALEAGEPVVVESGEFLVVARDPEIVEPRTGARVLSLERWEALSVDDVVLVTDRYGTPMDVVRYERDWGGDRDVSLERVRADLPADDRGNWGSSVAVEGSTPGRVNSIHVAELPTSGRLSIAPNPFSPDGDGIDERCSIRFDLPTPQATVRLTIYDVLGRIRAVLRDHALVASSTELVWDGTGTDGATLPAGVYVACLEAIDADAGILVTAKKAVGVVR